MPYAKKGKDSMGNEIMHGSAWGPASTGSYNLTDESRAWNPDFEKEAVAFEAKLGAMAFDHPAAKGAAEAACTKALQYMTARGSISDEIGELSASMEELLAECGGNDTWMAGNVGKEPLVVEEAMKSGNLREKMTAWHHFIEHVFMKDMKAPDEQYDWLQLAMEETGMKLERVKAYRQKYDTEINDGNPETKPGYWDSPQYADASGKEPKDGMVDQLGSMRANTKDILGQTKEENQAHAKTKMTARSSPTELSERELKLQAGKTDDGKQKPIDTKAELEWSEGMKARIMNEMHPWTELMREISVPLRAGPSGHTNVFMNGNHMLGVGADPDSMRLACLGYLLPINAHSMIEVLQAAKPYGASPYPEDRTIYGHILPLAEGELRKCGMPDPKFKPGRLPHEAPGADKDPNQRGRTSQIAAGGSASMVS